MGKKILIYFYQHSSRNAFAEKNQCACIKRGFFLIARKSDEVLQIGILCNLFHEFTVRKLELGLDNQCPQCHTKRFGNIAGIAWKQLSIFCLKFIPWDAVSHFDPAVIWIHMKSHRLVEVKERMLQLINRFVHDFSPFICEIF